MIFLGLMEWGEYQSCRLWCSSSRASNWAQSYPQSGSMISSAVFSVASDMKNPFLWLVRIQGSGLSYEHSDSGRYHIHRPLINCRILRTNFVGVFSKLTKFPVIWFTEHLDRLQNFILHSIKFEIWCWKNSALLRCPFRLTALGKPNLPCAT